MQTHYVLLRCDISALYFRKVFGLVIYNKAMHNIQRRDDKDAWLALGECRQKQNEDKTQI